MKSVFIMFFLLSASLVYAGNDEILKDYPCKDNISFLATFFDSDQPEINKSNIPVKWNGRYEFKKDAGINGMGALLSGPDGWGVIDKSLIDPKEGTIAFWFRPVGDPMGGSHTYFSWTWNTTWLDKNISKRSYMVISQGWWEDGGGAGSTYGIFSNNLGPCVIPSAERVGTWGHYVLTWKKFADGNYEVGFYKNSSGGKNIKKCSDKTLEIVGDLVIGSDRGSNMWANRYADGVFSEVIIWDKALDASEIKALVFKKAPEYVVKELENPFIWMDDVKGKPYREKRDENGMLLESRTMSAEGTLIHYNSREGILKNLDRLKNSGFNVYMPIIWHGAGMECEGGIIKSSARYLNYKKEHPEFDSYKFFIEEAHKRGIEVHSIFAIMQGGKKHAAYPEFCIDPQREWANGYDPKFRDAIVKLVLEHLKNYDVDGINLDFIRIQGGLDTTAAAAEYKRIYGRDIKNDMNNPSRMAQFTAECVSDIVRRISTEARKIRPDIIISCDCSSQTAAHGLAGNGRNPRLWIDEGWVDVAFNMDYGKRLGVEVLDKARSDSKKPYAWVEGIGNYDWNNGKCGPRNPALFASLMDYCRKKYNDGNGVFVYFWSTLSDAQIEALRKGPFKELAKPSWRK